MCLTLSEKLIMEELYEYNRIPLWIFDKNAELCTCFFSGGFRNFNAVFPSHMKSILTRTADVTFDVLCYENELYYLFSFERNAETFYLLGGPMLLSGFYHTAQMRTLSFSKDMPAEALKSLVENLPVISFTSFSSCLRIMMLLLKNDAPEIDEINNYKFSALGDTLDRMFVYELFENNEDARIHTSYIQELAVLQCVKDGDIARLQSTYKTLPQIKYGNMSNDPLKQFFYGCIANTTLVTRYAIEGGLEEEAAFTLSDIYIKRMENCRTLYELNLLNEKMALDFTSRVSKAKALKQFNYTKTVKKCIDYISRSIHQKITLDALAKEANLTPKYLSALFKKETGQTLSAFIMDKKINEAKTLLAYSDYSYFHISDYLSFYSQSHFIAVFKKYVEMTPKEYREKYGSR